MVLDRLGMRIPGGHALVRGVVSSRRSASVSQRDRRRFVADAAKASSSPAWSRAVVRTRAAIDHGAEDLLALLVADVQDYAILALDLDGNVVTWNLGAERTKGYRSEEIIGRHFSVFYPLEDIAAAKPERELAIAAVDGRMEDEGWRVRKDGTQFWANVVITALRDRDGVLRGYGKVTRDLSDRRKQQHAILDREQLVSGVLAAVTECSIIGTELDGTITIFNTGAERMLGYRAEEMVGLRSPIFVHDAGEIATRAAELVIAPGFEVLVAAARRGEAEAREWIYVRKDGSRLAVQLTVTAVLDEDRQPKGFIGVAIDVSERRLAEEALRAAEERFRRAFQDAPVGMAIVAASPHALGRFLDVNNAMCDLTGYDRDHMLGMMFQSLTHPIALDGGAENIGQLLSDQVDRYQGETRCVNAAGELIEVSIGLNLIRDDRNRPLHFIAMIDDVSSRKRYESQLQHMADHDPMTMLLNRARLHEALDAHVARVRRHSPAGALLMIDVDQFKQVNDRLGHHAGDELLVSIARTLQSRVRETDVLARLGGDEFAVLMTAGGGEDAQTLARDLSDLVRRRSAVLDGGIPGGITASIGIAVFDDRQDLSGVDILLEADTALYNAKEGGRDRIAAYMAKDGVRHQRAARLTMHHQIGAALKEDRFELLLQPVIDLRTGVVGRYEALLRMIAEDGSMLPPAKFLYVAERFEQILPLDRWVIEHGVALLERIPPEQALEINLSGRSLGDQQLAAHINDVLTAYGADPRRLIFEITETAAIENIHRAREFVEQLTTIGCRFALDDFGAGFGSFYYLKYLPFDYLKIDGEFVRNCTTNRTDQLVIQALVQLAAGLGKETIAEFVENADILRLVRALGVDHAQGYEIAHPLPLEQILADPSHPASARSHALGAPKFALSAGLSRVEPE
jgi:diguanylate cyclase (GGDEF)-like protein/PAS domain S-box-containing protein